MANRRKRRASKTKAEFSKAKAIEIINIVKIFLVVIFILIVFYFITIFMVNIKFKSNEEDVEVVIQYQEILAGETFNQIEKEYYVIFYYFNNHEAILYDYMIDYFNRQDNYIPLYKVDLNKGFNSSYLNIEGNEKAYGISELKVKGPTLIKIKDGQNVLYQDERQAISAVLMP